MTYNLPPGVSVYDNHINPPRDKPKRIKRIRSHTGHAQFLSECEDAGTMPRRNDIPSPYAYSPEWPVYLWRGRRVLIRETSHKCFDVFEAQS